MHSMSSNQSSDGSGRPAGGGKTRRVLNVRILLGTFLALMAIWPILHFIHAYQVRKHASALIDRAEAVAKEGKFPDAAEYYRRYLVQFPDDAKARMRRAELYDQVAGDRRGIERTIGLYQEALSRAGKGLEPKDQIRAQRRLTELLLQINSFAAALTAAEKLAELEKMASAKQPEEWYAPALTALALAGKHRENNLDVSDTKLDAAFADILEPKADQVKPHVTPDVYLARYRYRLEKARRQAKDPTSGGAFLAASDAAKGDLDAAVKMAPESLSVLLAAAGAAQQVAAAAMLALRDGSATAPAETRAKLDASCASAIDFYERAIQTTPTDPRAFQRLGQLYMSLGNPDRAIQTWRRGLKGVVGEGLRVELNLSLADALLQQGRLTDAENALRNVKNLLEKLDPKSRLALQRLVDLRSGKLAFQRGRYEEAIHLVTDLASGKVIVQGEENTAALQVRYEAWYLMGRAYANLRQWDSALAAFEQAALLSPREAVPHLTAAETCLVAGRRDAAIAAFQRALDVLDALKPPPVGQQLRIYGALTVLLQERQAELADKRKRGGLPADQLANLEKEQTAAEGQAKFYRDRGVALIAASTQWTLLAVNESIRTGNLDQALSLARRGVESHPGDPLAYMALGRAEQANKHAGNAADAYRKAMQAVKGVPASQMELVEILLASGDPGDAAEGEKLLRDLLPHHSPAALRLVVLLASRRKFDEAVSLAQDAVKSNPKDAFLHVALGTAWLSKNDRAKAEVEFQEAVRLAPDAIGPQRALLEYYTDTGRTKLARETLDKFVGKLKLPEVDRELFRGDMLVRIGDRKAAKEAYRKAAENAKNDPNIEMRLAEYLLRTGDPDDELEGEKLLRRIMPQHDPARRRLADALVARGGEAEWEEAQKLLEQSAGDPIGAVDRFTEARSLMRRGGSQNLDKAAAICQELLSHTRQPQPGVSMLLAQIRELQGDRDVARKQYLALVNEKDPTPGQLTVYIGFLLRHGLAAEADQRLQQLEKLAPEDLSAIELRARWLRDQKRTADIEPLVEGHAQKALAQLNKRDASQETQLVRAVGDLYERIELYSAAERWYRRLPKLGGEMYEPLVMALAKQGRIQEAMALCEEASKNDDSVRPALMVAQILSSGRATPRDMNSAEPYLKKILESNQDQPDLLNCLASIRVLQDRPKDAIELYRRILKLQPRNVAVLNNLATILAEQPEPESRQEGLDCVERAIDLAGPRPSLLDTKGMIFYYDGKPDQAVGLLQAATQSPNPDPRYTFHLAAACWRLDQLDRARAALRQARDADLEHQLLTSKDRQLLVELEKHLAQ